MRENMGLYRGKRLDNGEWIYGSLLKIEIDGVTAWVIFGSEFHRNGNDVFSEVHAHVGYETVGECTGLPDKNGKKIFEGDIVKFGDKIGYINYGTGCFCVKWVKPDYLNRNNPAIDIVLNEYPNDVEVIGNIHDNPELLGGDTT